MKLNWSKMAPEETQRRGHEARKHLRSCVKIYKHQIGEGRYYLHEHPMDAGLWQEPEIKALIKKEHNILNKLDQCQC